MEYYLVRVRSSCVIIEEVYLNKTIENLSAIIYNLLETVRHKAKDTSTITIKIIPISKKEYNRNIYEEVVI